MTLVRTHQKMKVSAPVSGLRDKRNGPRSRKWVLVMDNDAVACHVICRMLESGGYRTYGTNNSDDAVSSYVKARDCGYPFDAVILDHYVPHGKNIKESIKELLAVDPDVRVILATEDTSDPVAENFSLLGFKGTLPKPCTLEQLDEKLRTALDGKSKCYENNINY
jgi:two-component system, cell cycle sensor histidine kinase and response regulator CckA